MLETLIPIAAIALHWLITGALVIRILSKRRSRGASFAWIMLTLGVPYVGAVLYLIVGEVWLPRRRMRVIAQAVGAEPHADPRDDLAHEAEDGPDVIPLLRGLALDATGVPMTGGNELELLDGAERAYQRVLEDIAAANRTCFLLTYIWHPDGATHRIAEALVEAAQRGVDCRVLVDAYGGADFFKSDTPARLRAGGVQVAAASPIGWLRLKFSRIDLRNHRKIVVVDGDIGYTGSLNIVDPARFKAEANVGQWVDCVVRLVGPAANDLERVFLRDWLIDQEDDPDPRDLEVLERPYETGANHEPTRVQVLSSGPAQDPRVLQQMLGTLLFAARREIIITTPYFVPSESMLAALVSIARAGVRVALILPERVDAPLVRYASRAYYRDLLDAGVEIHLFREGLLHSKTVSVDGAIAMVGTANMDLRSFDINLEVSLFVFDAGFTDKLRALQQAYIDQCHRVDPEAWAARPRTRVMLENLVQLAAPIL